MLIQQARRITYRYLSLELMEHSLVLIHLDIGKKYVCIKPWRTKIRLLDWLEVLRGAVVI